MASRVDVLVDEGLATAAGAALNVEIFPLELLLLFDDVKFKITPPFLLRRKIALPK